MRRATDAGDVGPGAYRLSFAVDPNPIPSRQRGDKLPGADPAVQVTLLQPCVDLERTFPGTLHVWRDANQQKGLPADTTGVSPSLDRLRDAHAGAGEGLIFVFVARRPAGGESFRRRVRTQLRVSLGTRRQRLGPNLGIGRLLGRLCTGKT